MSIFDKVATAHLTQLNAEKAANERRLEESLRQEQEFEESFASAVTAKVLPYFNRLKADIEKQGFVASVVNDRDGNGLLNVSLQFVPLKLEKRPAIAGRETCVFQSSRATKASLGGRHISISTSKAWAERTPANFHWVI